MPSPTVLLVSAKEDFLKKASWLLMEEGFEDIREAKSSGEALRKLEQSQFSLAIISSGLKDMASYELVEIIDEHALMTILLTSRERFDVIQQSFENTRVMVLPKPVNKQTFVMSLTLMRHIIGYKRREEALFAEDGQAVDRAKKFLMESFEMTEPKAYRFLQKCSMNLRITLKEMAAGICVVYGIEGEI